MKIIILPLLLSLLLLQTFSKWVVILDYRINKKYIAEKLCENKARPALRCNGKCQLMKKLAAEEKPGTPAQAIRFPKENIQLFYSEHYLALRFVSATIHYTPPFNTSFHQEEFRSSVFHPPCS
jgi:hypothetical protein